MKLQGFIGAAYQLDSVNVDNQRCVNLYPEVIESGYGKAGQVAYLRATPGLDGLVEVGNGPIRCLHVDSIGRIFVVSANQIYALSKKANWRYQFAATVPAAQAVAEASISIADNTFTKTAHGFFTGLKVQVSNGSSIPGPLTAATDYFVIRVDADTFKLATNLADAIAGTAINITSDGTGDTTVTPQAYASIYNLNHSDINFLQGSFYKEAHGYLDGLAVTFKASGDYPTEITPGTTYYITNKTNDTFQLASSYANALAGTAISLIDPADAWTVTLLGSLGEYGGDAVVLAASSGAVKAASMSFGGDGVDSSTVFVDGSNNYLLQDDRGNQSFGILGEFDVARAVFNITADITVQSAENVDELVSESNLTISASNSLAVPDPGEIVINFYKQTEDATGIDTYWIDVFVYNGGGLTLTTAQLVQYMNQGFVTGKTIVANDFSNISDPPTGYTRTPLDVGTFSFSGGDSTSSVSEFSPAILQSFSRATESGEGFGSVPTATQIVWSDGYFIVNESGTNKFYVSDLQGFEIDALSFASSEGSPDIVLALKILNRYLYVFNEKTTEVYANTGNADFPFERVGGGFIETGCAAAGSVAKVGNSICWLGRSEDGEGVVYAIEGLQPRRISTHAIEQAINGYADPSSAVGYSYQIIGHVFYVLNFAEATWVYDLTTRLWHERAYTNAGTLERHRAQHCVYDASRRLHLVSDHETSDIFIMSEDYYSDDGDAITRLRSTPHISNGRNRVFCSSLQLDMEVGIGLDGGVQGSSPTVMLDWSNDGGHTWSSEQWALADAGAGTIGDYSKRVIWNRLGSFRQRVFRVKITDPVKVRLIDAQIELEAGAS